MNCAICAALTPNGQSKFRNKIILETENFALIPSIGPLCVGHVLFVSKKHTETLAGVSHYELVEFERFFKCVIEKNNENRNFLFVEHGSYDNQKGGACVQHTHIHLIPGYEQYYNILDNTLRIVDEIKSVKELNKTDFPYILSFNYKNEFRLYEAYNVHSQMMRKAICAKNNIKEWAWRKNPNMELIKLSILFWRNKNNGNVG